MSTTQHQFVYEEEGKKTFALLPISKYEALLEAVEDSEDQRLYDEVKREDTGERISLAAMKKRLGLNE